MDKLKPNEITYKSDNDRLIEKRGHDIRIDPVDPLRFKDDAHNE